MAPLRLLIPRLAMRNVLRNKRRSLISGSVVFFGVLFLVVTRGFIDGLQYGSERTQIDTNCAHLRIVAAGTDDTGFDLPLTPHLPDANTLLEQTRSLPGFAAATPRLRLSAEVSDGRDTLRVVAIGVEPQGDAGVFRLGVDPGVVAQDPPGILVGSGIMTLFEKKLGDQLTVVARTPAGAISALDFIVTGIVSTGNPAVDNLHVLIPIDAARQLLTLEEASATEVAIRLASERETDRANAALQKGLPAGYTVKTWFEATEDVRAMMNLRRKGINIIVFVIMAIAGAGIANTVLMSIYERFREIGTTMAFGFPPSSVRLLFLLEGIQLGLIGSLAGALVGGAISYYFERNGIDVSALTRETKSVYPVPSIIYAHFTITGCLIASAFGVLVATLATLLPARRASLLEPVEALRS